jgi:hypothetical protein
MFERKSEPVVPVRRFVRRMALSCLVAAAIVGCALSVGVLGYHAFARLRWIDSLLNATMILTGMGPVDPMPDDGAKLFASLYALFCGVVFLSAVGVVLAPVFHRVLHRFHMDDAS